jgi:hypothetical protein
MFDTWKKSDTTATSGGLMGVVVSKTIVKISDC